MGCLAAVCRQSRSFRHTLYKHGYMHTYVYTNTRVLSFGSLSQITYVISVLLVNTALVEYIFNSNVTCHSKTARPLLQRRRRGEEKKAGSVRWEKACLITGPIPT